jgi:hypothetical protein
MNSRAFDALHIETLCADPYSCLGRMARGGGMRFVDDLLNVLRVINLGLPANSRNPPPMLAIVVVVREKTGLT